MIFRVYSFILFFHWLGAEEWVVWKWNWKQKGGRVINDGVSFSRTGYWVNYDLLCVSL